MTRIQTLPFDAKIVLGDATARSFAFVAHYFNGACGDKFKFYEQVFVETRPEATDELIMPGAQDPGIKLDDHYLEAIETLLLSFTPSQQLSSRIALSPAIKHDMRSSLAISMELKCSRTTARLGSLRR
jgi:hypothetical protein